MATNDIFETEKRIAEKAAIQRKARETSPVSRPTPLQKSETTPSPLRAIPIVGPAAGAVVESLRRLDPTRVVSGISQPLAPPAAAASTMPAAAPTRPKVAVKPAAPPTPTTPATVRPTGALRRTTTTTTIRQPSPADQALAEYNRLMGKEGGGIGEAFAAQGFMNKYKALKPLDIEQEKLAAEESRFGRAQAQERALKTAEREDPTAAARARLYGAQAGVAENAVENLRVQGYLQRAMYDPKLTQAQRDEAKQRLLTAYGDKSKEEERLLKAAEVGVLEPEEARARLGYANGGAVSAYGSAPQANPLLAQYGQYLQAASQSKVPPVPFEQYVNLLASTRSQMGQTPSQFADGGEVEATPGYARPKDVDWTGVLNSGLRRMVGAGQPAEAAAAPVIAPASAPAASPSEDMWSLDPAKQQEIEDAVRKSQGYARGGAIDVSGKKLVGPGTGTSDSIPAVIDGHKPAALSSGEFVIPAHVVRAKGTEFFDKLIAQYADNKGQGNGE